MNSHIEFKLTDSKWIVTCGVWHITECMVLNFRAIFFCFTEELKILQIRYTITIYCDIPLETHNRVYQSDVLCFCGSRDLLYALCVLSILFYQILTFSIMILECCPTLKFATVRLGSIRCINCTLFVQSPQIIINDVPIKNKRWYKNLSSGWETVAFIVGSVYAVVFCKRICIVNDAG
jgi:hypothetical protein